jgi:hypothetical protein
VAQGDDRDNGTHPYHKALGIGGHQLSHFLHALLCGRDLQTKQEWSLPLMFISGVNLPGPRDIPWDVWVSVTVFPKEMGICISRVSRKTHPPQVASSRPLMTQKKQKGRGGTNWLSFLKLRHPSSPSLTHQNSGC